MILIDFSAIAFPILHSIGDDLTEETLRIVLLNKIREYKLKYQNEYGQVVLAFDSHSWRKDVFKPYKAKRKQGRDDSKVDFEKVFKWLTKLKDDIRENFPFPCIEIYGCEADDIIGVLAENTQEFGQHEPIMIVSGDKDFVQLQRYSNIKQFSPVTKKQITLSGDVDEILLEHIARGDASDGIPNIHSQQDHFINEDSGRQPSVRKTQVESWIKAKKENRLEEEMGAELFKRFEENRQVIDLRCTPSKLKDEVLEAYNKECSKEIKKSSVFTYLTKNRCRQLIGCVKDFK